MRIEAALLLPGQSCALHAVFTQVSDRDLHVRERVGVPVARRADLLEVICGVEDKQRQRMNLRKKTNQNFACSPEC